MTTDRFHRAAKDGLIDVLKEATRRDCNGRDETNMTPTLWAAFEGNLDALRLLVGKGGDPDKADQFGNSALHLASARGHRGCASFLINFGANLYALDVDQHTPQELAAINSRDDILRMLDAAAAQLEAKDKKKAKHMREKAKKNYEKRLKKYNKLQQKAEMEAQKQAFRMQEAEGVRPHRPSNVIGTLRKAGLLKRAQSHDNLSAPHQPTYSDLVGAGMGTTSKGAMGGVQRKAHFNKLKKQNESEFRVTSVEDGKHTVRSLEGVIRDSEVMFVPQQRKSVGDLFQDSENNNSNETKTATIMPRRLSRTRSQPDFIESGLTSGSIDNDSLNGGSTLLSVTSSQPHTKGSIFERPGFGSVAFRRSLVGAALIGGQAPIVGEDCSIGSAGSLAARQQVGRRRAVNNDWRIRDGLTDGSAGETDEDEDEDDDEDNGGSGATRNRNNGLERFLASIGLSEHIERFAAERIDLEALMLLSEDDLRQLQLPLGHRCKLTHAIQERRAALTGPAPALSDTKL